MRFLSLLFSTLFTAAATFSVGFIGFAGTADAQTPCTINGEKYECTAPAWNRVKYRFLWGDNGSSFVTTEGTEPPDASIESIMSKGRALVAANAQAAFNAQNTRAGTAICSPAIAYAVLQPPPVTYFVNGVFPFEPGTLFGNAANEVYETAPYTTFVGSTGTCSLPIRSLTGILTAARFGPCPAGYKIHPNAGTQELQVPLYQACVRPLIDDKCTPEAGNPISISGQKIERETDLDAPFNVHRAYRTNFAVFGEAASRWRWSFQNQLAITRDPSTQMIVGIAYVRHSGDAVIFAPNAGAWVTSNVNDVRLSVDGTGWKVALADDTIEFFDASGRLLRVQARNGNSLTNTFNAQNLVSRVTDSFGRAIDVTYESTISTGTGATARYRVKQIKGSAGQTVTYDYSTQNGLLEQVLYSDGSTTSYAYTLIADQYLLSLKTNSLGNRSAFSYDATGRATRSEQVELALAHQFTLAPLDVPGQSSITLPNGTQDTYTYASIGGVHRLTGTAQPCATGCGSQSQAMTYDANGFRPLNTSTEVVTLAATNTLAAAGAART